MKGEAMKRKQGGMTLIGFVMVLMVVCFFGYMAMVLGPAYSEYWGVVKAMNFVAGENTSNATDLNSMTRSLGKQFNVGYVESIGGKDVKLVREKTGNSLVVDYEVRKGFVYNIDFVLKFHHSVPLGSKTAGD